MKIFENYSLKHYNTFGIDAKCRYFYEFQDIENVKDLLSDTRFSRMSKLILGGGSNILLTKNFEGLVLKNNLKGITLFREDDDFYYIKAGAGENWHQFVLHCIHKGYAGLENLSLIPGNVGAGPMQNIGAYGVEIKDVFFELEALHISSGITRVFKNEECHFGYRESIFKNKVKGEYIITSVTFRLRKKPIYNISYGAIEQELEKMKVTTLSIKAISEAVCSIRSSKLPDPKETGNAGSFFKNPVVTPDFYSKLKESYPSLSCYDQPDGNVKLAAGWLIEQCGWKGKRVGDAGVHKNQALVLVNYGNASGNEIYKLSEEILQSVYDKFGVKLEREVNIL